MRYWRQIFFALLMVGVSILTYVISPEKTINDKKTIDLESMVPVKFGQWRTDSSVVPMVSPNVKQNRQLGGIYSQVLMRTYINDESEQIMLTIAYGGDQSDRMQLHKPEVCYAYQGFQIIEAHEDTIKVDGIDLPVKRLKAVNGLRHEPITYWIMLGEKVVSGKFDRKVEQIKYGLTGLIPDGMLIRVSNISKNEKDAYDLHKKFISELYHGLDNEQRRRVVGE